MEMMNEQMSAARNKISYVDRNIEIAKLNGWDIHFLIICGSIYSFDSTCITENSFIHWNSSTSS